MTYYKYINANGATPLGYGHYNISELPTKWHSVEGDLVQCRNGLHVMRSGDVSRYYGELLFEAEVRGDMLECDHEVVVREMRIVRQTLMDECRWRLHACDCAARSLARVDTPDARSVNAVVVARRYAIGDATDDELAAAHAAAWAAAYAGAAAYAAWEAGAYAAAYSAWEAAAEAPAAAERAWQAQRLLEYAHKEQLPEPVAVWLLDDAIERNREMSALLSKRQLAVAALQQEAGE